MCHRNGKTQEAQCKTATDQIQVYGERVQSDLDLSRVLRPEKHLKMGLAWRHKRTEKEVEMKSILLALIPVTMSACTKSNANGTATAEVIASPISGYNCFVIRDGSGTPIGGNCVKE